MKEPYFTQIYFLRSKEKKILIKRCNRIEYKNYKLKRDTDC